MEAGAEVGEIDAHLDGRLEAANLAQLRRPVIHRLGERGRNRPCPRTRRRALRSRNGRRPDAGGRTRPSPRVAIGWPVDPLALRNRVQQTELVADAIVGPAFELEQRVEIRRRGHAIEQARRPDSGWGSARGAPVQRTSDVTGLSSIRPAGCRGGGGRGTTRRCRRRSSASAPGGRRKARGCSASAATCRQTPAPDRGPADSCRCR